MKTCIVCGELFNCNPVIDGKKHRLSRRKKCLGCLPLQDNWREGKAKRLKLECHNCGKDIERTPSEARKNKNFFCSRSCAASFNNKGVRRYGQEPRHCSLCNKRLKSSQAKYCSHKCYRTHQEQLFIKRWLAGKEDGKSGEGVSPAIKRYLLDKYDGKCQGCGWAEVNVHTGNVPLGVHHVDGNSENNRPENLKLFCPNCHSLTPNYGSRNKGKGRKKRQERRKHAALV